MERKDRKILIIGISILIVAGCFITISTIIFVNEFLEDIFGPREKPCFLLPDIETVRDVVDAHQDVISQIENTSPGHVFVWINERCDGKGELHIIYDTIETRDKILEIIGGDTFFGVPYLLFNI